MNFKHQADSGALDALDSIASHLRRKRVMAKLAPHHQMPHAGPDPTEEPTPESDLNINEDGSGAHASFEAKLHEVRKAHMASHEQMPHTGPDELEESPAHERGESSAEELAEHEPQNPIKKKKGHLFGR